ncbi:hypothetical protein ILP92_02750 [Maribius pontilimi]|uniref:Uncharacterized protein n=1 Tax=Palleronia pontilimi TaxID=1964209 RepID=A0A934MBM8_9RHOB|nr:DUF6478 family protein [Palleronia pontilimi]MBJ3761670.1 hypothetical protein [Palleronia pontilimi]
MKLTGGLDELAHRRALKRWSRIADAAPSLDAFSLRVLRGQARLLRDRLDRVIAAADTVEMDEPPRLPWPGGDWAWRPALWKTAQRPAALVAPDSGAALGQDLKLFHDCAAPTITLRQHAPARQAPHVALDILDFDGSFLSLVLDLPDDAVATLARRHILRVALLTRAERPVEILARLNLRQGPNTVQMVVEAERSGETTTLEFDLAYSDATDKQVDGAWIDLIFDRPAMNRIELCDLVVSRGTRHEM